MIMDKYSGINISTQSFAKGLIKFTVNEVPHGHFFTNL